MSSDQQFLSALGHTLGYSASALTIEFLLGFTLGALLNNQVRGRGFFRSTTLVMNRNRRNLTNVTVNPFSQQVLASDDDPLLKELAV